MSLSSGSTTKKRSNGNSKKTDYGPIGDPVSEEGVRTGGLARACDVIYYIIVLGVVIATLILVILLWIHVCAIETDVKIIKDCVTVIKDCVEYIKECVNYIKDCVIYLKEKVDWIHDVEDEQRMIPEPYDCDDGNVCTKDFIKQGACMSFPIHCQDGQIAKKDNHGNRYCPVVECHDKCFDDPILVKKDSKKREAQHTLRHQSKSGSGPNGECGIGATLGQCVPSTPCKGTCDPNLEYKKDVTERNEQCPHPECPHINFLDVFYYGPFCSCSDCHRCEYEGVIHIPHDYLHPEFGPLICQDKKLQEEKCMAGVEDYLKECLQVTTICEQYIDKKKKKDEVGTASNSNFIEGREYPIVEVHIKCRYSFACAKPVLPLNTEAPTPPPTILI